MGTHRPAGQVRYLRGGGFYVQAYHPGVNFCPRARVSPDLDAASSPPSVLNAVDAIDADEDDDQELVEVPVATARCSGSSLQDAGDAIDSDDEEPVVVYDGRGNAQPSSLLDAVSAMGSDDDEQSTPPVLVRRTGITMSGAALDLCPTVDLSNSSDMDSSSSSSEEVEEDDEEAESDEDSDEEGVVSKLTVSAPRPSLSWDYMPEDQVDNIIRSNMTEIEAKKPWRFVFRCLVVPFNFKRENDPFDVFFMRWDDFWRLHGRAVWERAFWQPLLPRSTEYYRRKSRQSRAQSVFRELATDLVLRLGDPYRCWLGKVLHEGWWYRIEPFPLRRLFLRDRRLYEEYLVRRVKERWPRGMKFLLERGLKPMWWLPDSASEEGV